jgi:hypothetical protein
VYATLALLAAGEQEPAKKSAGWLRALQKPDGGWPPQSGVEESTWVTALVALLPVELLGAAAHDRAVRWLVATSGRETSFVHRLRMRLLGNKVSPEAEHPGWPWVPGTAAWVGPTAVATMALAKEGRRVASPQARERVEAGRRFLRARMCRDGGWNHGSVPDLSEMRPYPETTGLALAGLRGVNAPWVDRGIAVASGFLPECRSADALNWLRLGLLAHGKLPDGYSPPAGIVYRTVPEVALHHLACAAQRGLEVLWS